MKEIWKDIEGYEGLYQVSNLGRVRSLDRVLKIHNRWGACERVQKGRVLKPHLNKWGYYAYGFYDANHKIKSMLAHRLVAIAFIPNLNNLPQVNHKDENKTNNFVWVNPDGSVDLEKSNLEWCDANYNINYGTGIDRRAQKRINGSKSKRVLQYDINGKFVKDYPSLGEVVRKTGYAKQNISIACLKGVQRYGFIWRYAS